MALLSIITINYNDKHGLQKTIASVKEQTFTNYEFVIIDGNSNDGSKEVIQEHQALFSHWVSEPDSGIFNAQNKGVQAAKGDYLLFLNSGDVLNGATVLHDFIHAPEFKGDIIYGDYKYHNGGKQYPDALSPLFFFKSSLPHQSTLFKARVFETMGLQDEQLRIAADRAFYMKCYFSEQFVFSHVPIALTLFDLTGVSNDPEFSAKKELEDTQVLKQYFGKYYPDYAQFMDLQAQLSAAKRNSLNGILKRVKNRLKL